MRVAETPNPATADLVGVWDMTSLVTIKEGLLKATFGKTLKTNSPSYPE
ncbi:hypothetical protein [Rhodocytophaga aerolata]|nr:hypothetical protein [Rhodocytophaga aerolata]